MINQDFRNGLINGRTVNGYLYKYYDDCTILIRTDYNSLTKAVAKAAAADISDLFYGNKAAAADVIDLAENIRTTAKKADVNIIAENINDINTYHIDYVYTGKKADKITRSTDSHNHLNDCILIIDVFKNYHIDMENIDYRLIYEAAAAAAENGLYKPGDLFTVNSKTFKLIQYNKKFYLCAKSIYTNNFCAVLHNDGLTAKMQDVCAFGTTAKLNDYCKMYCNTPGAVCEGCYACETIKQYESLDMLLSWNAFILTREILPYEMLPDYNTKNDIKRIEAFGDLYSLKQAINYINICLKNPETIFVIMTKNTDILAAAFKKLGFNNPRQDVPNMIKIQSALMRNDVNCLPDYEWIDHVFVVCEGDYAAAHNIEFTCCDGVTDRKCNECRRCYTRENMTTDFYIFEKYR